MLPKNEKLDRLDFQKLKGLKFQKTPTNIGVFCFYGGAFETPKFAVVVSKKFFKTAVARNKTKRCFYNFVKNNKSIFTKTCVFYPNKNFTTKDLEKIATTFVV